MVLSSGIIKTTEIIVKKSYQLIYRACKNDMECYHKLGQQISTKWYYFAARRCSVNELPSISLWLCSVFTPQNMYTTHTDYEKWSKTRKGQPTGKDCEKM